MRATWIKPTRLGLIGGNDGSDLELQLDFGPESTILFAQNWSSRTG